MATWFAANRRDLPWRQTRDPYRVWLSEIMLQQTQVATVVPYFAKFIAEFPSLRALAAAHEQAVLRCWEGLGYYRRARQLHRAAQTIVEQHRGEFPRSLAEISQLPGIGRYTAGAILSIAFDLPTPILEANTVRLLSRLTGDDSDTSTAAAQRRLWSVAAELVPVQSPGDFNQALMELGSLVCTPRDPDCQICPVARWCRAGRSGRQREIPRLRSKPRPTQVDEAAVVVRRAGRLLVRQARAGERWAGLWDFPRFALDGVQRRNAVDNAMSARLLADLTTKVKSLTGVRIRNICRSATLRHSVTRYRITLHCFDAVGSDAGKRSDPTVRWVRPVELTQLPMSTTGRKLGKLVTQ